MRRKQGLRSTGPTRARPDLKDAHHRPPRSGGKSFANHYLLRSHLRPLGSVAQSRETTNSCGILRRTDIRLACSIGQNGLVETFAASRPNVGNGVKGRLCADVLVIPISRDLRSLIVRKVLLNVRSSRERGIRVETAFRPQTGLRQSQSVQGPFSQPPISGRSERCSYAERPRRISG